MGCLRTLSGEPADSVPAGRLKDEATIVPARHRASPGGQPASAPLEFY